MTIRPTRSRRETKWAERGAAVVFGLILGAGLVLLFGAVPWLWRVFG